jgi:cold-inducible RNA-binding protein
MSHKLFVGRLPASMGDRELKDLFAPYNCVEARIIVDRVTRESRGFGFVVIVDDPDAAIRDLNGKLLAGGRLNVALAKPPTYDLPREYR